MEYKRHNIDKDIVRSLSVDLHNGTIERVKKMAELKVIFYLAYMIGIPLIGISIAANLDNWKSIPLFVITIIYWSGFTYFALRKKNDLDKERKIELRKKEIELWYEEQKMLKEKNNHDVK